MDRIRETISLAIRGLLRLVMRVWFVFPVRKNRVLVDSMWGKSLRDNAGYWMDWAREHGDGSLEVIWGVLDPKKQAVPGAKMVRYRSVKWFYFRATAKVILYSHHLYNYLPLRKGQYHVMMWHAGGAYKRIGAGVKGNTETDRKLHEDRNRRINDPRVVFLSSSGTYTRFNIQEVYGFRGRIGETGMQRNDLFFDAGKVREASEKVRARLGIPADAKVTLYAPTFRMAKIRGGGSTDGIDSGELSKALREAGEENPVILYRCHYYERSGEGKDGNVIDVSAYPDMQELLCCADRLITDYSSCIWDYSLLKRPCYLFVPDLDDYENREQGFFTPIGSWPGLICGSMEALGEAIAKEDPAAHARKAEEHHRAFGSYEDGKACERLYRLVKELMTEEA